MAIVVNDILEIRLAGSILNQETQNIFTYKVSAVAGTPSYQDVIIDWATNCEVALENLVSAAWSATMAYVRNLTNGLDIDERAVAFVGAVAGTPATSMLAYGFRYNRASAVTRHGQKRFAGVDEGDLTNNDAAAGAIARANTLAAALDNSIAVDDGAGNTATLVPVIVGRITVPGPGYGGYDLTKINTITGVTFTGVTSQVSRKAGRGS